MAQGDWGALRTNSYNYGFFGIPYLIDIGIVDGAIGFTGLTDGFQGTMPVARPANSDQMRIGVKVLNPTPTPAWAGICGKADWSQQVLMGIRTTGVEIHTSTAYDSSTPRASSPPTPIAHGDILWLQRNVEDDAYYVFRGTADGIVGSPIVGWGDDGHVIAHGSDFRLGVIRLQRTGGVNSARLEDIRLQAAAPLVIGVPDGFPYTFPVDLGAAPNVTPPGVSTSLVPVPGVRVIAIIPPMPSTSLIPVPTARPIALPLTVSSVAVVPVPAAKPVAFVAPAVSTSVAPVPTTVNDPVPPAASTSRVPVPTFQFTATAPPALSTSVVPVPVAEPAALPVPAVAVSVVPVPATRPVAFVPPALSTAVAPIPAARPVASALPALSTGVVPVPSLPTAVVYDTVSASNFVIGTNTATATATLTQPATVAADANCLIVPVTVWDNGISGTCSSTHTRSVTYNGVAMTSLGMVNNSSNNGGLEFFKLQNPAAGTFDGNPHDIVVTVQRVSPATAGGTWAVSMPGAISAKNVVSVTAGTGQGPASGTPSVSVNSNGTQDLTIACIGTTVNDPGGYNKTQRGLVTTTNFSFGFAAYTRVGTAPGASPTVTHSESASGNVFVAQAINLSST